MTTSTIIDYREGTLSGGFERIHQLQFQVGSGEIITINYDFGLYDSTLIMGRLQDIVAGTFIDTIIFGAGSYLVQDPAAFNKLKLTLIYKEQVPSSIELDIPESFQLYQNY
ncbi:MAG: hypothetical protein IH618_14340 [Ignavibacteriaceae bacterium]|nr:hypothetical protein [Ignavibacteriaceae bacterium]